MFNMRKFSDCDIVKILVQCQLYVRFQHMNDRRSQRLWQPVCHENYELSLMCCIFPQDLIWRTTINVLYLEDVLFRSVTYFGEPPRRRRQKRGKFTANSPSSLRVEPSIFSIMSDCQILSDRVSADGKMQHGKMKDGKDHAGWEWGKSHEESASKKELEQINFLHTTFSKEPQTLHLQDNRSQTETLPEVMPKQNQKLFYLSLVCQIEMGLGKGLRPCKQ